MGKGSISVYDSKGSFVGCISMRSFVKRTKVWMPQFYEYDGEHELKLKWYGGKPAKNINSTGSVAAAVDRIYERYLKHIKPQLKKKEAFHRKLRQDHEKRKQLASDRRDQELRTREKARLERRTMLKLRLQLVDMYLSDYSDECRAYVMKALAEKSDSELDAIVATEMRLHPHRYADLDPQEQEQLRVLALANTYSSVHDVSIDELLAKAHFFYFDEEAWWEARLCTKPLERLPYPVCLVEDVILYVHNNEIRETCVTPDADPDVSRKLMSFVVNSCSSYTEDGLISYRITNTPLLGEITVSTVTSSGLNSGHDRSGIMKSGRSPRMHTRRGHWRNQPYGPRNSLRKRIWICETIVTPSGKPYQVTEASRVHMVTFR